MCLGPFFDGPGGSGGPRKPKTTKNVRRVFMRIGRVVQCSVFSSCAVPGGSDPFPRTVFCPGPFFDNPGGTPGGHQRPPKTTGPPKGIVHSWFCFLGVAIQASLALSLSLSLPLPFYLWRNYWKGKPVFLTFLSPSALCHIKNNGGEG